MDMDTPPTTVRLRYHVEYVAGGYDCTIHGRLVNLERWCDDNACGEEHAYVLTEDALANILAACDILPDELDAALSDITRTNA